MIKIPNVLARIKGEYQHRTFKEYGSKILTIDLDDGPVRFAKWQHPQEVSEDFDQRHVDFFKRWTKPGDLVIDIGAFTGDTTVPMALAVGPRGLALALEPNPYVFKILKQNSELNKGRANIVPLKFAASERDETLTFNYSDASFCNGGFLSRINSRDFQKKHPFKLDVTGKDFGRYLREHYADRLPKLSLIKIDAEGFDKDIIRNLKDILLEFRPTLITECLISLDAGERQDLYDAFRESRYVPHYLQDFSSQLGQRLSVADMQARQDQHFEILARPEESAKR